MIRILYPALFRGNNFVRSAATGVHPVSFSIAQINIESRSNVKRRKMRRTKPVKDDAFNFAESHEESVDASSEEGVIDTSSSKTLDLHDAAERGDYQAVNLLLQEKAVQVNQGDPARANATALHIAARAGHLDIAEILCNEGADVNSLGPWNMTPIMYAIIFGKETMVDFFLTMDVDINKKDARGRCARERGDHSVGAPSIA